MTGGGMAGKVEFSTDQVREAERFPYYREALSTAIGFMPEPVHDTPKSFRGAITARRNEPLQSIHFDVDEHHVRPQHREINQTCVRLVRADYCGDGVGHTRNGTRIGLFDRIGIQRDEREPGISFEAAFTPEGASCVAHPRLADGASLERLTEMCPRLAAHVGPSCDETAPGLIFVRSHGR